MRLLNRRKRSNGLKSTFENLTNPALLFFVLGIFAVLLKSDLEIPKTSSNFISLYLLFSIGKEADKN